MRKTHGDEREMRKMQHCNAFIIKQKKIMQYIMKIYFNTVFRIFYEIYIRFHIPGYRSSRIQMISSES